MTIADEDELVRLEELAQIGLRQDAGVTGIAGALEAVQSERGEGVGGGDLVGDEEAAARTRYSHQLGEHELGPRHVMKRPERAREIERGVVERQVLGVALYEGDVAMVGGSFPAELEQLRDPVDADDLADDRREGKRKRARAGADVDRALVSAREDERMHDAGKRGGALVLARGDLRGRPCEAVRRRRRHGAPAGDCC